MVLNWQVCQKYMGHCSPNKGVWFLPNGGKCWKKKSWSSLISGVFQGIPIPRTTANSQAIITKEPTLSVLPRQERWRIDSCANTFACKHQYLLVHTLPALNFSNYIILILQMKKQRIKTGKQSSRSHTA